MNIQKKKILVCPLNWGLGHATRDIAIISRLLDLGHEVVIAGDGAALDLLEKEFSEIVRFPSYLRIRYSVFLPAWLKITLLSPFLLFEVIAEHFRLAGLIKKLAPDIVISDNRYGLWNRKVKSILITHQLSLRLPRLIKFLEYPAFQVMKLFIRRFDQCWIPDYPGVANLSGELSHRYKLPENAVFIGAVSRFKYPKDLASSANGKPNDFPPKGDNLKRDTLSGKIPGESFDLLTGGSSSSFPGGSPTGEIDLLILLSGPEPQRSKLQKIVLKQAISLASRCVILQGIPGKYKRTDLTSKVTMYNHLPSGELKNLLISAGNVICRSGYTGIMDLVLLQKKALIIPTPGQTEQEYLADYLAGKGMFLTCRQDELNLESSITRLTNFYPEFKLPREDLLGPVLGLLTQSERE